MDDQAIDFVAGSFSSLLMWFFGGLDGSLSVLITLIVIDAMIWISDHSLHGKLNLEEFTTLIERKIMELCFIGIAHIIDRYLLGNSSAIRTGITLFYIVVEGKNIIKHADAISIPIPDFLKTRVFELEKKLNSGEGINMMTPENIKEDIEKTFINKVKEADTSEKIKKQDEKKAPSKKHLDEDLTSVYRDLYNIDG